MTPNPWLVPCLQIVRAEFNALNPKRDKRADGWIGDSAHREEVSDHNPDALGRVLAVDIDSTGPWPMPFDHYIASIVSDQQGGDGRLEYVIWSRSIASRSTRWQWVAYDRPDPHTGHAHLSARHDHHGQDDTSPWGIGDIMTPDDIGKIASAVWGAGFGPKGARETAGDRLAHVDQAADNTDERLVSIENALTELLDRLPPPPAE